MAGYGVVILVLTAFFLEETLPAERRIQVNPVSMVINFARLLRNRAFVGYGACVLLTMGAVMVGYSLFGYLSGRLVGRLGIERLIDLGTLTGAFCGLVMLGLALAGINAVWAIMVPMFGFMAASSFVVPTATAGALSPFGHMAGSAMANLAFFQTCFSALVAFVVGILFDGTQMPMVIVIGILGVSSLIAYLLLIRPLAANRSGR